jgi:hypothetical protein
MSYERDEYSQEFPPDDYVHPVDNEVGTLSTREKTRRGSKGNRKEQAKRYSAKSRIRRRSAKREWIASKRAAQRLVTNTQFDTSTE